MLSRPVTDSPHSCRKLPSLDDAFSAPRESLVQRQEYAADSKYLQHCGRTRLSCIKAARGRYRISKGSGLRTSTWNVSAPLRLTPPLPSHCTDPFLTAVTPSDALRKTLDKALKLASPPAESADSAIHSLLPGKDDASAGDAQEPLHLSLSRPLILQTNQRAELKSALADLSSRTKR